MPMIQNHCAQERGQDTRLRVPTHELGLSTYDQLYCSTDHPYHPSSTGYLPGSPHGFSR